MKNHIGKVTIKTPSLLTKTQVHSLRDVLAMAETITEDKMEVMVDPAFVCANDVKTLCGEPSKLGAVIGDWNSISLESTLRWMLGE
ncbi:MAG: hypothetical protein JZU65_24465 [Chlorobium sp.]|nr:hypothetical protein [Chlorobium sp.]